VIFLIMMLAFGLFGSNGPMRAAWCRWSGARPRAGVGCTGVSDTHSFSCSGAARH